MQREVFEADEYSKEPFEWAEVPLKPNTERPVMIHRAILGSVERFIAMLTEHTAGKWPFWLSPRQVIVCPITDETAAYAEEVYSKLRKLGYEVELDLSKASLNKKIRTNQQKQFNYILVVGQEEAQGGTVAIRARDNTQLGTKSVAEFVSMISDDEHYPPGVPKP